MCISDYHPLHAVLFIQSGAATPIAADGEFTLDVARGTDVKFVAALVNVACRSESSRREWTTEEHPGGGQHIDEAAIAAWRS